MKQDCFAMKQDKPDCMLLDELYCERGHAGFTKVGNSLWQAGRNMQWRRRRGGMDKRRNNWEGRE